MSMTRREAQRVPEMVHATQKRINSLRNSQIRGISHRTRSHKSIKLNEVKIVAVVEGGTRCTKRKGGKKGTACHRKPVNGVQLRIRGDECVSKRKETGPAKESSGSDISVSRLGWLRSFLDLPRHRLDQNRHEMATRDRADSWKLMVFHRRPIIARLRVLASNNTHKRTERALLFLFALVAVKRSSMYDERMFY